MISKKESLDANERKESLSSTNETEYLCSIPVMKESIVSGMQESLEDVSDQLEW